MSAGYTSTALSPPAADLSARLQRLVFERRQVSAAEVLEALRADFCGCEPLRQLLLTGAPKYGNGDPEVDAIAARVAKAFIDLMDRLRQAQRDPERYGNIPVRVAGYSQMFKLVPPDLQEHIIARLKHRWLGTAPHA